MNGDEFDRLARDLVLYPAEPGGIAIDADDPPHLPRRNQRGFAAAEFEQRRQPRELQLDLRDFGAGQMWSHGPLPTLRAIWDERPRVQSAGKEQASVSRWRAAIGLPSSSEEGQRDLARQRRA